LPALSCVARCRRSGFRDSRRAKLEGFALVKRIFDSGAKRNAWPHKPLQTARKNRPVQNPLALEDFRDLHNPLA